MRKQRNYALAVVLVLAVIGTATSAFAQSDTLRAKIPFEFYVGDKLLPAGTYTITPSSDGNALRVSGPQEISVFVVTAAYKPNHATDLSRLVFRRYGTQNFLASAYWVGYRNGKELARSLTEQKLAQNGNAPTAIAILIK